MTATPAQGTPGLAAAPADLGLHAERQGRGHPPRGDRGDPLVSTKLSVRSARHSSVPRQSLYERIDDGMEGKLTLISAPAGFGKTTLLSTWVAAAPIGRRLVSWLSLDARDNDPVRFWRYFVEALARDQPGLGLTASALLGSPHAPPIPVILTTLINELEARSDEVALVLDDYHVVESRDIHESMGFLLDNLPPTVHLIIATRADPPLQLSRLRAGGELVELRAHDLRFSVEDAEVFLKQVMGLELTAADASELVKRTEGWVSGLQMAALAMRGHADIASFITAFTGSNRFVVDYLADEVLARQPVELRAFLLHTSVLDRMCASLCQAVTSRSDSQEVLEGLEHNNLFVDPLDDSRGWYRYHQLFADVLKQRLGHEQPELVHELERKASEWFEGQGLVVEAIQHALHSSDAPRAIRLIERVGSALVLDQQVQTVLGWLGELPSAQVSERPVLCTIRALALVFSNRPDAAESSLEAAERSLAHGSETIEARTVLGRVAVIRAAIARFSGDLERSVALGREAMGLLPDNDSTVAERASAKAHASLTYLVSGEVRATDERPLTEAIEAFAATGGLIPLVNSINRLGRFQIMQGRLRTAYETYQASADAVAGRAALPEAANSSAYFVGLGDICRQWNDLDLAEQYLREAIELVAEGVAVDAHVVTDGYLALARVYRARGLTAAARDTLDEFARVARQRDFFPLLVERGSAEGARLALSRQDLVAAVRWAEETDLDERNPRYPREDQHLTLARVDLAQGRGLASDRLADGLALLDRLLTTAEAAGRMNSVIEIHALRALAFQAQLQPTAAVDALEKALIIAEPGHYVRVFVDEGPPMVALLTSVLTSLRKRPRDAQRDDLHGYVGRLLAAFEAPDTAAGLRDRPVQGDHLLTPLAADFSEREMAVLRLLASNQSQREIAGLLFISFNTVKTHSKSIFRRLGVGTRADAVARARDLHLIH